MLSDFLPIGILLLMAVAFAGVALVAPHLINRTRATREKMLPYECGVDPVGDARGRFAVHFYIVAMMFIIFDVEVVFLYPWAVAFRQLRLFGFLEMLVFLAILLVGYAYLWRRGAFEWE
jgi:NADH-quinone oxidoreductase subunit A